MRIWDFSQAPLILGEGRRNSRRILEQLKKNEKDGLERIAVLAATETATISNILCKDSNFTRGWSNANNNLQMENWAFEQYFVGAIINEETGEAMEYRDLIKHPKLRKPGVFL